MATVEGNPSILQFFAWKLGKALDTRARKEKRVRTIVQASIRVLLHIVGFSCLTIAAFHWHVIAGWVVVGISCFVMAELLSDSDQSSNDPTR